MPRRACETLLPTVCAALLIQQFLFDAVHVFLQGLRRTDVPTLSDQTSRSHDNTGIVLKHRMLLKEVCQDAAHSFEGSLSSFRNLSEPQLVSA